MGKLFSKQKYKAKDEPKTSKEVQPLSGGKLFMALYDYIPTSPDELSFRANDFLWVRVDPSQSWWFARHKKTFKEGYVPQHFITEYNNTPEVISGWYDISRFEATQKLNMKSLSIGTYLIRPCSGSPMCIPKRTPKVVKNPNKKSPPQRNSPTRGTKYVESSNGSTSIPGPVIKARALYGYTSQNAGDLSFSKGDFLIVASNLNEPWWLAKHTITNRVGYIPSNYVVIDDGSPASLDGWFNINRAEAEKKLILPGYKPGTYIVRPSSEPNNCALSVRHFDRSQDYFVVRHYRIRTMDKGGYFIVSSKRFPDIRSLISYYTEHSEGLCCCLTSQFPRKHQPPIQFRDIEVNRNCLKLGKKLGNGSFGEVFSAKWNNSVEVAVKMLKGESFDKSQRQCFLQEAKLLHQIFHPRIVEILGVCSQPIDKPVYIITELMANGSLLNFLIADGGNQLNLKDLFLMMNQIADGMGYLESKNFVHRDLRAANILVAEDISVKVADFGLARVTENVYEADPGGKFPIKWTAPEAGLKQLFSVKSDVWSFGVVMYEIVTYGGPPYAGIRAGEVLDKVNKGYRMPNPHGDKVNCPPQLYDIMKSCWNAKPENRPTFSYLKDVFANFAISTEGQYHEE